jgi:hypothetical protein
MWRNAIAAIRFVYARCAWNLLDWKSGTIVRARSDGFLRRSPPNRSVEIHEPGERLALIQ